jgi:hypothetical protein
MIRNTILGLAAVAALAMTASAASAHGYGYYKPYYKSYNYCPKVFVGYKTVWTYYGYVQKPIYRRVCSYGYGY